MARSCAGGRAVNCRLRAAALGLGVLVASAALGYLTVGQREGGDDGVRFAPPERTPIPPLTYHAPPQRHEPPSEAGEAPEPQANVTEDAQAGAVVPPPEESIPANEGASSPSSGSRPSGGNGESSEPSEPVREE